MAETKNYGELYDYAFEEIILKKNNKESVIKVFAEWGISEVETEKVLAHVSDNVEIEALSEDRQEKKNWGNFVGIGIIFILLGALFLGIFKHWYFVGLIAAGFGYILKGLKSKI